MKMIARVQGLESSKMNIQLCGPASLLEVGRSIEQLQEIYKISAASFRTSADPTLLMPEDEAARFEFLLAQRNTLLSVGREKIMPDRENKISELEAKFAEAERLRLYNLDQVTDLLKQNAWWQADNRNKAAIIKNLYNMLGFMRKASPEEYFNPDELAQIDAVLSDSQAQQNAAWVGTR